jgi:hypothetical protein
MTTPFWRALSVLVLAFVLYLAYRVVRPARP